MKKLLFCLAAIFPLLVNAQDKFTINGKIGTLGIPAKVYMAYKLGVNKMLDSAYINGGQFTFSGEISSPTSAVLMLDHTGTGPTAPQVKFDVLSMFLDKGTINITGTDSIATAKITGSQINDDNAWLMAKLALTNARAKKLDAIIKAVPADVKDAPEVIAAGQDKRKAIQADYETTLKGFITSHPNSYISLLALNLLKGPSADAAVMEPLYNGLSADLKQTEPGKLLAVTINESKATAIGTMAPDFTQPDANGTPVSLSSFRGKYVLIDFWAAWCAPCRLENPNVVRAYNKYKTKKFTVLGVSLDPADSKAAWIQAIQNDGLTWPQVSDLKYWNNAAAALYFVHSIPQNFLLDPTGKIIAKNLRGDDLENKLAEIFGKI